MLFIDLGHRDQIRVIKDEFVIIVRSIFERPNSLKQYVNNGQVDNDQSQAIFKSINELNDRPCVCCRHFAYHKLCLTPIDKTLEPLLEIAKINVKTRNY